MGKSYQIVSLLPDGVFQFEATFTSYQQMEFDLPKGSAILKVKHAQVM